MSTASEQLRAALASADSFQTWLKDRGFAPVTDAPQVPAKQSLRDAQHYHSPEQPRAPYLLVLYNERWNEQSLVGRELRVRQRDANEYQKLLRAQGHKNNAPALCLLACPQFLVVFELNGDPFARRLRFTTERLSRPGSPLEQHFARFRASTMAGWARDPGGTADWIDEVLNDAEDGLTWDFSQLYVGSQLDQQFVRFMDLERGRISSLLLDPKNRQRLLEPMWSVLRNGFNGTKHVGTATPTLERIALDRKMRSGFFATVDTVLLRIVLYRYLEAQFGYQMADDERREIALGSYDEVLERTVKVDRDKLASARAKGKTGKASGAEKQLDLFAHVDKPELFVKAVKERADWYQRQAGGDLHYGTVAEAADILQNFLLEHHRNTFAELLAGTSTDEYSFHYADLDPRALQQFYEGTIGTDLRVVYDPTAHKAHVDIVPFHRNRKEQGAYYTDETLCRWLVERTLGRLYGAWESRFHEFLKSASRIPKGRTAAVRALLDELLGWRVLDPTCGGGIFLRSAFDFLVSKRGSIIGLLERLPEDARREAVAQAPYKIFAEHAETGDWEWHILLHMLYGVDIDVKAINVASNLLTLSALSYKRNGVCFPSFIHTSLKPGNALVNPLRTADRERLAKEHGPALARILELRAQLRDPKLAREEWMQLHAEVRKLTVEIVRGEIEAAYSGSFEGLTGAELVDRVQRVGTFLYEAEFPEVFFTTSGKGKKKEVLLRDKPGFDVVLGNPPWEEPAAEYKQFLPEFDPEYKELTGKAAQSREQKLLADPEIKKRWDDYVHSISDFKELLTSGWYEHQRREVRGKIPGAHTNLYKYAVETAWKMLRNEGYGGLVLDGGLWNDLAASGLRRLLIDECSSVEVCGFNNNEGLFPDVDRRYKFSASVFKKGGRTDQIYVTFMHSNFDALARFDSTAVVILSDEIRQDLRDSFPVAEVRNLEHYRAERTISSHAPLDAEPWSIDTYSEELNSGRHRPHFSSRAARSLPVLQGAQFGLFGVHSGKVPEYWLEPDSTGAAFVRQKQVNRILDAIVEHLEQNVRIKGTKTAAAQAWLKSLTGSAELPKKWLRMDWDGYRLAWRTEARNDDKRTLIVSILPPRVAVTDKAPFVRPFKLTVSDKGLEWTLQYEYPQLLYLAGMLSSFACDSVARTRLAKKDFKSHLFRAMPVPPWRDSRQQRRIAELCARLTCLPPTAERPWADYSALAAAVGLNPAKDGLVDPAARREAESELNAIASSVYGLDSTSLRFLMDTLFMTPMHKDEHAGLRDDICARLA